MNAVLLLLAIIATLAIFATTRAGREVMKSIGLRDRVPGAAPREDVAYLAQLCGGEPGEIERRLSAERDRVPDLTEAEHYRRAIRKARAERSS